MNARVDHKEGWTLKNWCFWTVMLEKTLESLMYSKEIKPVHPKEINPELEELMLKLQYFGHLKQRAISLEKTLMLKDWRQEEKGTTEDEIIGWHHCCNGHEFEQAPGVGDGQGGLRTAVHGVAKSWTQLSNGTRTTTVELRKPFQMLKGYVDIKILSNILFSFFSACILKSGYVKWATLKPSGKAKHRCLQMYLFILSTQ